MEETFSEPCDLYYKIFTNQADSGYKYRSLSPFEFKNTLIKLATKKAGSVSKILNAGRGNPNFFAVVPRYAFALLMDIATELGDCETSMFDMGLMPTKEDIVKRFNRRLWKSRGTEEGKFLKKAVDRMQKISGLKKDDLIHQMVISALGCFYPDPPRVQQFVQPVLAEFFEKVVYKNVARKSFPKIKIFPTEGATAAIV
jgi:aspartate 4-decarboxylase